MEQSENSKDIERLYLQVCKIMKKYSYTGLTTPTKEEFQLTVQKFNALVKGHEKLLTAIGKL